MVAFDVDGFVAECVRARGESEPRRAVQEVLERAVARGPDLAGVLRPEQAGITPLHVSPELTVLHVVWGPGMRLYPHDHRMWATIGIYSGGEDNTFYRRARDAAAPQGARLVASGGKALRPGDTCLLGDDVIHAVANPTREHAGTIHVYGGDFFATPRSQWDPDTFDERPHDGASAMQFFADYNAREGVAGRADG